MSAEGGPGEERFQRLMALLERYTAAVEQQAAATQRLFHAITHIPDGLIPAMDDLSNLMAKHGKVMLALLQQRKDIAGLADEFLRVAGKRMPPGERF